MRKLLVILLAIAFVAGLGLPAMAGEKKAEKEFTVYGSVRMQTFIQDFDKENAAATANQFDDKDLIWQIDTGSRLGFRAKMGDIGGNIEYRPQAGYSMVRMMYGTWNFGPGTLLIGHGPSPTWRSICDECMITGGGWTGGYGDWGGTVRQPGLQLWFPIQAINGQLQLAAMNVNTTAPSAGEIAAGQGLANWGIPGFREIDTTLPELEFALIMSSGPFSGALKGNYQTFDAVDNTDKDYGIDTWALGADATWSMGPFSLQGNIYMGQNMKRYVGSPSQDFYPTYFAATGGIEDVDSFGFAVTASYKFSDKANIDVGYAQRKDEIEIPGVGDAEGDASTIYAILNYMPAKGLTISPEIAFTDEGELKRGAVTTDRGNRKFYGIYWRIDF